MLDYVYGLLFYPVLNLIRREAMDFFTLYRCFNKSMGFAEVQQFAIQIYSSHLISYDDQVKLCLIFSLDDVFEIPYFF